MNELLDIAIFYYPCFDINILGENLISIIYLHGRDLSPSKRNVIAKISRAGGIISSICTDTFPQARIYAPSTSTSSVHKHNEQGVFYRTNVQR